MVIIAYMTNTKLRTTANLPLVNLAIADLLTGLISIPWACWTNYFVYAIQPNKYLCISNFIFLHTPVGVSGVTMLLIAAMKCYAVIRPVRYKSVITPFRVKTASLFLWIYISFLMIVFILFGSKWDERGHAVCVYDTILIHPKLYSATVAFHVAMVGIISVGLYIFILRVVSKRGKRITSMVEGRWRPKSNTSSHSSSKGGATQSPPGESTLLDNTSDSSCAGSLESIQFKLNTNGNVIEKMIPFRNTNAKGLNYRSRKWIRETRQHAKAIKLMVTVLVCFYLCWVPTFIKMILDARYKYRAKPMWLSVLDVLSVTVVMMNSFCNPIIYAGLDANFRNTFAKILHLPVCK